MPDGVEQDEPSFRDLIARVRGGDERAAAELVRRYEPAIRRAVRFRLTDPRLRRVCDSMDVAQSVLLSFFLRAASGQYELDTPEQLLGLLTRMAYNKALNAARAQQAARRDAREVVGLDGLDMAGSAVDPCRQLEARELLQQVHALLSPEERRLVELRNSGRAWDEIAAEVGGNPAALRQQLHRALARLTRQLGLEEGSDE